MTLTEEYPLGKRKLAQRDSFEDQPTSVLDASHITPQVELSVGVTLKDLRNIFLLESIRQFGPQKFKDLEWANVSPVDVLDNPDRLPIKGKRGETFHSDIRALTEEVRETCHRRAVKQILTAHKYDAKILTYRHPSYPRNVYDSNNPIPVLFVRGSLDVLQRPNAVACVGSRNIRAPYLHLQEMFASTAIKQNITVVSGFALGADSVSHTAALKNLGPTICVMPSGLERPFPPENRLLWEDLLRSPHAAFVTEFSFGVRAASLTLRKRNKLIVAFAKGVLIGQSSVKGGAMNSYRFAREQHKPVATFADDGTPDTSGNNLISEEKKPGDEIFPTDVDSPSYEQWLQRLCSST